MNWEAESVQFTHEQGLVRVFRKFNFPIDLHLGKHQQNGFFRKALKSIRVDRSTKSGRNQYLGSSSHLKVVKL